MPTRRIACGACSRDDPHPKFALTINTRAWRRAASSNGCISLRAAIARRSSSKR